jgi:hypothetical protein
MSAASATRSRHGAPSGAPSGGARARSTRSAGSASAGPAIAERVRWDRLGRMAMLCVLVALVYLYASAGFHMLSTWRQSRHDKAAVATLEREHRELVRQRALLSGAGTLEADARQLGMMRPNEQPYVISGLPDN